MPQRRAGGRYGQERAPEHDYMITSVREVVYGAGEEAG
jgi:hypothetical protein